MQSYKRRADVLVALMPLPEGKRPQDVLPAFSDVTTESMPIGNPCPVCPGCKKKFTVTRKRRAWIRLYPAFLPAPVVVIYGLCGSCARIYRKKGATREALIAKIQAFMNDD